MSEYFTVSWRKRQGEVCSMNPFPKSNLYNILSNVAWTKKKKKKTIMDSVIKGFPFIFMQQEEADTC